MAQFSTPPIERRPMTTKQARKKWQRKGCPTVSSGERRKINREAERERKAQEIRDKEQRKKDNKKKRDEKEAHEKEKRLRMGIQDEVKLPEGQLGLGQFFTAKTTKIGAIESYKLAAQSETIQDQDFNDSGADGEGVLFWNNTNNDAICDWNNDSAHNAELGKRGSQKQGSSDQRAEVELPVIVAPGTVHTDHDRIAPEHPDTTPQDSKIDCVVILPPRSSQRRLSRPGTPVRKPLSKRDNSVVSHAATPASWTRRSEHEHEYHEGAEHKTGSLLVKSQKQQDNGNPNLKSASVPNRPYQEAKPTSKRPSFFANYAQYMEEKLVKASSSAEMIEMAKSAPVSRQVSPEATSHRRANSVPHTAMKRNSVQAHFDPQEQTQNDKKDADSQSKNRLARKRRCISKSGRKWAEVGDITKPEHCESILNMATQARPISKEISTTKVNDSRLSSPVIRRNIPSATDSFSAGFSDIEFEEFGAEECLVRRQEEQSADLVTQGCNTIPSGETSFGDSFDGGLGDDDLLDIDEQYEAPAELDQAALLANLEPRWLLHDAPKQMPSQPNPTEINTVTEMTEPSGSQSSQSFGFDFGSDDLRVLDCMVKAGNRPSQSELPIPVAVVHESSDDFDCSQDLSILAEEITPDFNELAKASSRINRLSSSHLALNNSAMPPPPVPKKKHQESLYKKPASRMNNSIIIPVEGQDEFDSFFAGSTQALLAIDI